MVLGLGLGTWASDLTSNARLRRVAYVVLALASVVLLLSTASFVLGLGR
jgi:hypothetical protein